jgi:hypothetical protein
MGRTGTVLRAPHDRRRFTGTIYTGEVFAGERVQRFVPANSPRGKVLQQLSKTPLF